MIENDSNIDRHINSTLESIDELTARAVELLDRAFKQPEDAKELVDILGGFHQLIDFRLQKLGHLSFFGDLEYRERSQTLAAMKEGLPIPPFTEIEVPLDESGRTEGEFYKAAAEQAYEDLRAIQDGFSKAKTIEDCPIGPGTMFAEWSSPANTMRMIEEGFVPANLPEGVPAIVVRGSRSNEPGSDDLPTGLYTEESINRSLSEVFEHFHKVMQAYLPPGDVRLSSLKQSGIRNAFWRALGRTGDTPRATVTGQGLDRALAEAFAYLRGQKVPLEVIRTFSEHFWDALTQRSTLEGADSVEGPRFLVPKERNDFGG